MTVTMSIEEINPRMVGLFATDTLAAFSFYFSEQNFSVFRPMQPISTFSMQNLSQSVEDFI
jgi:hypothetical protein